MSDNRRLCVKVQLIDDDIGETITETVVIRPAEGDDKLALLSRNTDAAVEDATRKMRDKYAEGDLSR